VRLLELGGGTNPHPLADAVLDSLHPANAPTQDIGAQMWRTDTGRIPAGSVEAIYASHVLEHIAKGAPILHVMAEAWRVLVPGGTFTIKVPVVGYDGRLVADWRVYADPTHVSLWWFPEGLLYFCEGVGEGFELPGRRFAPLGPWYAPQDAYETVDAVGTADQSSESFWSVGDGWEGLAALKKPE
jgi:hypothetical protein